jgi:hypothetical protein
MTLQKKLGLIGLTVGGLALIALLATYAAARLHGNRTHEWNSVAVESTLAGVRVRELDATHAAVVFSYDLDNRTDTDYRLSSGANVVIMSRLQPNGSLSSDQQVSLDSPAFVPARNRTRIALEMRQPFDWPAQRDAAAERQVRQLVADEVAGLQGFVLFDQSTRYQIELATVSPELQQAPISTAQH